MRTHLHLLSVVCAVLLVLAWAPLQQASAHKLLRRFDTSEHGNILSSFSWKGKTKQTVVAPSGAAFSATELIGLMGDWYSQCKKTVKFEGTEIPMKPVCAQSAQLVEKQIDFVVSQVWRKENVKDTNYYKEVTKYTECEKKRGSLPAAIGKVDSDDKQLDGVNGNVNLPDSVYLVKSFVEPLSKCTQMDMLGANDEHFSQCALHSFLRVMNHAQKFYWEKSDRYLFYVFYALHFLSDQFAPGHVRTPAMVIKDVCELPVAVNVMHNLDNLRGLHLTVRDKDGKESTFKAWGDGQYWTRHNIEARRHLSQFVRNVLAALDKNHDEGVARALDWLPRWSWDNIGKDACPLYLAVEERLVENDAVNAEQLTQWDYLESDGKVELWRLKKAIDGTDNLASELPIIKDAVDRTLRYKRKAICNYIVSTGPSACLAAKYEAKCDKPADGQGAASCRLERKVKKTLDLVGDLFKSHKTFDAWLKDNRGACDPPQ